MALETTNSAVREAHHADMFNPDKADKLMLLDHLIVDHQVDERRANADMTTTGLVVTHLARHDKTAELRQRHDEAIARSRLTAVDDDAVRQLVDHVEIHGPIPEGGIVVLRGGEFTAEMVSAMSNELLRVAGHDRFVLVLLHAHTPGALAVLDARMAIDEIKAKLGVD